MRALSILAVSAATAVTFTSSAQAGDVLPPTVREAQAIIDNAPVVDGFRAQTGSGEDRTVRWYVNMRIAGKKVLAGCRFRPDGIAYCVGFEHTLVPSKKTAKK